MARLPQIPGRELVRALENAGLRVSRQRGSHLQLCREEPDGSVTTFPGPVHAGKTLKKGTFRGILRKAGLEVDELIDLL